MITAFGRLMTTGLGHKSTDALDIISVRPLPLLDKQIKGQKMADSG